MTTGDFDRQAAEKPSDLLKARRRVIFQLAYPGVVREEIAFKAYFRSLCSLGKVEEAEKLLSVTKSKDTCVYNSYVKALFRAGRIDDALRFFGSKRNKELVSSIIFGLCENGKVDDGHRLLDETITEGFVPTARVLNCIIKSYWENGREEKAREMFRRMSSESCSDYRTKPDSETYSVMIGKFLEKGEVDIGVSLLDEMRAKNLKAGVDLYCDIVRGLYKCGRVEEGEKWMNAMIGNGILVSYESWESLYDSVIMEGDREIGELWKEIEANCKAREDEKRRLKRK
ncbi:uncharacterized protein A4U43_C08F34980 [Asparagus officinalis]|nr:uncharacterized protein A4U43_C08F34980 [Asparagus officinalis]